MSVSSRLIIRALQRYLLKVNSIKIEPILCCAVLKSQIHEVGVSLYLSIFFNKIFLKKNEC